MTSTDKFGIIFSIAITIVAVVFAASGGLISIPDMEVNDEKKSSALSTLEKEALLAKKVIEDVEQMANEAKQSAEKAQEITKEAVSSKLPSKFVSIPKGTSVPGCEKLDFCYDPPNVIIFVGGEVLWRNDDLSAHTVTSGMVLTGPDGNFDSSLLRSGETFSHMFEKSGKYNYFCMIHPWATGSVTVN